MTYRCLYIWAGWPSHPAGVVFSHTLLGRLCRSRCPQRYRLEQYTQSVNDPHNTTASARTVPGMFHVFYFFNAPQASNGTKSEGYFAKRHKTRQDNEPKLSRKI